MGLSPFAHVFEPGQTVSWVKYILTSVLSMFWASFPHPSIFLTGMRWSRSRSGSWSPFGARTAHKSEILVSQECDTAPGDLCNERGPVALHSIDWYNTFCVLSKCKEGLTAGLTTRRKTKMHWAWSEDCNDLLLLVESAPPAYTNIHGWQHDELSNVKQKNKHGNRLSTAARHASVPRPMTNSKNS